MKLTLRSLESKETLKINVEDDGTWQQLKETLIIALSPSSSSPSSLHLSFNRDHEIHACSPHDSLFSMGITDGDLLFFTLNPNAFSPKTLIHKPPQLQSYSPHDGPTLDIHMSDATSIHEHGKSPTLDVLVDGSVAAVVKSNSQNSFLKWVLSVSLRNDVKEFTLLVAAVHAAFLESGFVLANYAVDDVRSVLGSALSFKYSLPEIMNNDSSDVKTVTLKFQTLGHLLKVCGSLSGVAGSGLHWVYLNKHNFVWPLYKMLKNSAESEEEGDIFELWKVVKDRLALPLLIDLCDNAGLNLPPCLMRLPSELKIKILECIPGVDLAKVACLCKELRCLSSSDDLWELKCEEVFGEVRSGGKLFKDIFALLWESKKISKQQWVPSLPFRPYTATSPGYTPRETFECPCCHCIVEKGYSPMSPAYTIIKPPSCSPMSCPYTPTPSYLPMSPTYTPTSPAYTPTAPSYSPTSF